MRTYSITHKASGVIVYIGSTHQPLCERKANHHYNYKSRPHPVHHKLKENDGWDAYEFKTISEHPGISRVELLQIESNLIKQHNPPYNTQVNTIRTKDIYNQYYKDRYAKNKSLINAKAGERYTCECGADVRHGEKARHFKSLKHINASPSGEPPQEPAVEPLPSLLG